MHTAAPLIPEAPTLARLRATAAGCTACPLHRDATQTVFGEGRATARWMMVGEIPGDHEDLEGHPFVGPAGRLLARCMEEAGLKREDGYLTNAVKHFKYRQSGKRRLHERPRWSEVVACRPWLMAEIEVVQPEILICLGATATRSLLGTAPRVTAIRGQLFPSPLAAFVTATVHPSSLLRARDDREAARQAFVDDLRLVARLLGG